MSKVIVRRRIEEMLVTVEKIRCKHSISKLRIRDHDYFQAQTFVAIRKR
jgi:hypothetical protein